MFNFTVGLDINSKVQLSDTLNELALKNIDLGILNQDISVENTIDFQIAENDKKSKELLVKLEQSRALPSLSSFLTGGYTSFSNSFDFLNKDKEYFGYAVFGVNMQIPILVQV
jgi:hypothetical protein